jgi:hypothetical protein
MIRRALLLITVFGGVAYAVVQTQRKLTRERARQKALEKAEKSRWENEGGAPAPTAG